MTQYSWAARSNAHTMLPVRSLVGPLTESCHARGSSITSAGIEPSKMSRETPPNETVPADNGNEPTGRMPGIAPVAMGVGGGACCGDLGQ